MLERVTVAPATIAPEVSVTVPRISPVFLLWGNAGVEMTSNRETASAQRTKLFMEFLPS